jgi:NAD(P)H dehydrogenase (quinone)
MAAGLRQHQVPEPVVTVMVGLTKAMAANELNSASPILAQVLGRKPTDLKAYLTTIYAAK